MAISNIQSKKENHINGYYILNIDFIQKKVSIKSYPEDKEKDASNFYSYLEKRVEEKKNAVVLVSVPKMKELQNAYPSYFLDTNNFIKTIDSMIKDAERFGWV